MSWTDVATLGMLAVLAGLILADFLKPARAFEAVRGWRLKGTFFLVLMLVVGGVVPAVLVGLLPEASLVPGERLGVLGGTAVGILVAELVVYWMHRLNHRLDFLWRWVHQMHHSAERMDIFGAGLFHPSEMVISTLLTVAVCGPLLGLNAEAAGLVGAWLGFNGVFQHGNIKTPAWLGYFIQRPEQHGVHHERGVHAFNYANLPLWDLVFGTFRNPAEWSAPCGFYLGSSKKVGAMLLGRDISSDQPTRTRETEREPSAQAVAGA